MLAISKNYGIYEYVHNPNPDQKKNHGFAPAVITSNS